MGSIWFKNKVRISVPLILIIFCIFMPTLIWSAGFQEEKLFDGDFYSSEDLRGKIEAHNREIQSLDHQIKALETDIDWIVLKINQVQDSGRTAGFDLKKSLISKEKKNITLHKTRNRLQYLVKFYSATLDTKKEQNLEQMLEGKISAIKNKAQIKVEDIATKSSVPDSSSAEKASGVYNGISKIELQTAVDKSGLSDWVEIVGTGTCLKIETTLPILFPTGSAKIAKEYKRFFKKLAHFLKPYDVKVHVSGYADTVPIKNKKYPSNFELGASRAANIVHQMVNHGLKPSIFRIESTGKYRVAAKGMSKQKPFERRAEVTVIFSG